MTNKPDTGILLSLFKLKFNEQALQTEQLYQSGSDRIYFRLTGKKNKAIGAFNNNISENEAFFSFTESLAKSGILVPEIFGIDNDRKHYLISDLGDTTLFDYIKDVNYSPEALCQIKDATLNLIDIQMEGRQFIDFKKSYPREYFDRQSIMWDLNYFKYDFLKITQTDFDEQALEDDFENLANELLKAPTGYFMYRDFQVRNIMYHNEKLWFIDYQGGRKGPLQYDLASILFSPKTGLNNLQRDALLNVYLDKLETIQKVDRKKFVMHFYLFALARILQAMGAYGLRGIVERKPGFKKSIPASIKNLSFLLENKIEENLFPEIRKCVTELQKKYLITGQLVNEKILTIRVTSFSYKKGYPNDPTDNGGGFVFDCRGLPNPGRFNEYKMLSGLDEEVREYLEKHKEVKSFIENVENTVSQTIENFIERGFRHLCVSFGCTGGQHRSVYNAEVFAQKAQNKYPVNVVLIHTEKQNWKQNGKKEMRKKRI
ncbi:MAG: phosphotransferase [Prolixibacteraceae bacterium]|jgi:aminoglycoside/choline kinase family phosphotransferase|nr:phosphotransferase [Prolixibacteraceae bacterium]